MPDLDMAGGAGDSANSAGADVLAADLDSLDSVDTTEESTEVESTPEPEAEAPPAEDTEELPEPDAVEEEPATEEEPVAAKDDAAEETPEGVTVRQKPNGKKEWVFDENRGRNVYAGYKAARSAEDVFGEPLTPELATSRQNAFVDQESMIADYLSGEPQAEGRFLNQLAGWAKAAQQNGDVRHNPLHSIAKQLPSFLAKNGGQEAFEALAAPVFRMQLDALYEEAIGSGNENILLSVQHLDNKLFGTYKKKAQIAPPDPLAAREKQIADREAKLNQSEQQRNQESFGQWHNETKTDIKSAVESAITENLGAEVVKSYEKFPKAYEAVLTMLHGKLQTRLKSDHSFQQELKAAVNRAANATPEVRQQIREQLQNRYKAKASFWMDPVRNPEVAEILKQQSAVIKQTSEAKHQRLQNGAQRREPGTLGTAVRQTVRQTPNGKSTHDAWADAIDAI